MPHLVDRQFAGGHEKIKEYRAFKALPKVVRIVGKATEATSVMGPTLKRYPAASESLKSEFRTV
jgi:hypothetical protein